MVIEGRLCCISGLVTLFLKSGEDTRGVGLGLWLDIPDLIDEARDGGRGGVTSDGSSLSSTYLNLYNLHGDQQLQSYRWRRMSMDLQVIR